MIPRMIVATAVFLVSVQASLAQTPTPPTKTAANDELVGLETALNEGVMHHDRAGLELILAEEFGLSLADRPAAARAAWLDNVERITVDGYKITEPNITVWGRVAVVRTRQHFDNRRTNGRVLPNTSDSDITDLWTYRD